ncbi:MAG: type II toxin-antitoxin system Phd/YefM family antitoxin [Pseudonocardiaceae bacterium]
MTQRELRNDSGAIMRAVERGESFTLTRNGTPVGRLIPLRRRTFVPRQEVMAAFAIARSSTPSGSATTSTPLPIRTRLAREW